MPLAAYMLGARVIEKHFTLNRAMRGTDHRFSLEPVGMKKMIRDLQRTHGAWRRPQEGLRERGEPVLKMGKKLVAARDLPAGPRADRRRHRDQESGRWPALRTTSIRCLGRR